MKTREASPEEWVFRSLCLDADDAAAWSRFGALESEARAAVVRSLKDEVARRARSAAPTALETAETLVKAAAAVPELQPLALRGRAVALYFNGRYAEARAAYEEAAAVYGERDDRLGAGQVSRNLIDVCQLLGDVEGALTWEGRARRAFEGAEHRGELARLEANLAVLYVRLDEYPRARGHLEAARGILAELGDDVGLGIVEFNLSVVLMNIDDLDACEAHLRSARGRLEAADLPLYVADCDYSLAYLKSRRGRFAAAIDGLERARGLYLANGKPSGPPLCDLDMAEIFLRLGAWRSAGEYADRAAGAFRRLGLDYETARCEILAGLSLVKLGSPAEALDRLETAASRFRDLGNGASSAAVEVQRAAIEVEEGAFEEALARLRGARKELAERELLFLIDLSAITLARAHLGSGRPDLACEVLEELIESTDRDPAFDLLLRADALALLAEARRANGDGTGATEALRRSVEETDRSYAQIPASDIRIAFLRERHFAFVELVWDLADRDHGKDPFEALALLERSRSRSLTEPPPLDGEADEELGRARERLDWLLARHLDAELGPASGDHDLRRGHGGTAAVERAQREVKRLSARSQRVAGAAPRFDEEELRLARGEGDVLCFYLCGDRGVRAFVVDDAGIHDRVLAVEPSRLANLRDRLWLHVDKLRLGRAYLARHRASLERSIDPILAELGQTLLEPLLDRIQGAPLVVLPFGILHDLPFHAFVVDGRPLVADTDVAYAFGARVLARSRTRAYPGPGELLACAVDPGSLHHVEDEIGCLAGLYGERLTRLEPDALFDRLKVREPTGGLLHLAAHAFFQSRQPAFSAVCLGDRFLLAHDIQRMRMAFDLVVLSGCETGRKLRVAGEELFGLARALVAAGSRATLGSLWAVDDGDVLRFMQAFYEKLADGEPCRAAVASAQRGLHARGLHPSQWASFCVVGAPDIRIPAVPSPIQPERS